MRYFRCVLFFVISISVFAQQAERAARQSTQYTCHTRRSDAGTLTSLSEHYVVGLQMALYAISEYPPQSPADVANLQFVYSDADPTKASQVTMTLTNQITALNNTQSIQQQAKAVLRNK